MMNQTQIKSNPLFNNNQKTNKKDENTHQVLEGTPRSSEE